MERKFNKQPKLKIKKGDMVLVIAGNAKGSKGRVLQVVPETNRVIVEGINLVSRHTKPTAQSPNGSIVKKEAPIHISNVQLIDAAGNATRVGRKLNEEGKNVRYSKKSGEIIK